VNPETVLASGLLGIIEYYKFGTSRHSTIVLAINEAAAGRFYALLNQGNCLLDLSTRARLRPVISRGHQRCSADGTEVSDDPQAELG
jgi:hypothetical protein